MCVLMLTPQVVYTSQISRDAETGISRGTAFVTMRSLAEARTAINALDGFVSRLHYTTYSDETFTAYSVSQHFSSLLTHDVTCFSLVGLRWA